MWRSTYPFWICWVKSKTTNSNIFKNTISTTVLSTTSGGCQQSAWSFTNGVDWIRTTASWYFREGMMINLFALFLGNDCNLLLCIITKHDFENFGKQLPGCPSLGCGTGLSYQKTISWNLCSTTRRIRLKYWKLVLIIRAYVSTLDKCYLPLVEPVA